MKILMNVRMARITARLACASTPKAGTPATATAVGSSVRTAPLALVGTLKYTSFIQENRAVRSIQPGKELSSV